MIARKTTIWWAPIAFRRLHGSDGIRVRHPYHRRLRRQYRSLRRLGMSAGDARDMAFYTLWAGVHASEYVANTTFDDAPPNPSAPSIPDPVHGSPGSGRTPSGGSDSVDAVGASTATGGAPATAADAVPGPAPQHSMWKDARL